jgi:hypothetical protein
LDGLGKPAGKETVMRVRHVLSVSLFVALALAWAGVGLGAEAPRMTKDELKGLLGKGDVVVIDVRTAGDWKGSDEKISGAVREEPGTEEVWASKYPKEKTLVLYCA